MRLNDSWEVILCLWLPTDNQTWPWCDDVVMPEQAHIRTTSCYDHYTLTPLVFCLNWLNLSTGQLRTITDHCRMVYNVRYITYNKTLPRRNHLDSRQSNIKVTIVVSSILYTELIRNEVIPYHSANVEGCNRFGWTRTGHRWTGLYCTEVADRIDVRPRPLHSLSGNLPTIKMIKLALQLGFRCYIPHTQRFGMHLRSLHWKLSEVQFNGSRDEFVDTASIQIVNFN